MPTAETWTIKRMLEWMEGYLSEHGDANPRASAFWLVSDALGMSRTELFLNHDMPLGSEQLDVLREYVRRRAAGEPLQYITGKSFFRHIEVLVEPGVLIPRPETEVLVSEVLARLPQPRRELDWSRSGVASVENRGGTERQDQQMNSVGPVVNVVPDHGSSSSALLAVSETFADAIDAEGEVGEIGEVGEVGTVGEIGAAHQKHERPIRIAEIGCGSGCIACSLAYEHPSIEVWCTDISPAAVALTKRNAEALGVHDRIHAVECDLGSKLEGKVDVVVSNPPYIPTSVMAEMSSEVVDYEPSLALDGGEDGLDVFRRIVDWASGALNESGLLACELHEDCLHDAAEIAEAANFRDIRIAKDLAGKERVLLATKM